jgi:hypothetical protein
MDFDEFTRTAQCRLDLLGTGETVRAISAVLSLQSADPLGHGRRPCCVALDGDRVVDDRWPAETRHPFDWSAFVERLAAYVLLLAGLWTVTGATVETTFLGVVGIVLVPVLFALWYVVGSNVVALEPATRERPTPPGSFLCSRWSPLPASLPLSALPDPVSAFTTVDTMTYGTDAV